MKKKLLAVFLFSATTMLCAQTLQTSNKYFEVGNFKEVHNPAWGVTDDPWCINDHTFIYDKKKKKVVAIRLIVGKKVKKITVPSTQISIPFGGSVRLEAAAKPENASYTKLHYEVKNPEIITVSAKGKVTSLASGSTSVTIYSKEKSKTIRKH